MKQSTLFGWKPPQSGAEASTSNAPSSSMQRINEARRDLGDANASAMDSIIIDDDDSFDTPPPEGSSFDTPPPRAQPGEGDDSMTSASGSNGKRQHSVSPEVIIEKRVKTQRSSRSRTSSGNTVVKSASSAQQGQRALASNRVEHIEAATDAGKPLKEIPVQANGKSRKGKEKAAEAIKASKSHGTLAAFLKKSSIGVSSSAASSSRVNGAKSETTGRAKEAKNKQALLAQPLSAPKPVLPPVLPKIASRLPLENIFARMWLYETIVRFDAFDVPRKVIAYLDRFDAWTEDMLRTIFERFLCYLTEVPNIRVAHQGKKYGGLLKTYQEHCADSTRGEAWEAVRLFCENKGVYMPILEDIEILPEQVASASRALEVDPTDTLLGSRSTGGRRAATTAALARVKSMSAQENRKTDFLSDEDEDDFMVSRRGRRGRKRGQIALSGDEEEEYQGEDSDEEPTRRSSRNKPATRARAASPQRRSARQQLKVEQAVIEEPESGVDSDHDADSVATAGEKSVESVVEESAPSALPVNMPPFEQRVAILCGFAAFLLQKREIADEIVEGIEKSRELEKDLKERQKELQKQQDDEMRPVNKKRLDMQRVGKGKEWTAEQGELAMQHEYDRIDLRMSCVLPMEAHKARAGPLGTDVDGNEYWQLTEFNEQMPASTQGQWSWSLLTLGTGFPSREAEAEDSEMQLDSGPAEPTEAKTQSQPEKASEKCFYGTNHVNEIENLIAWVRYRQKLLDFEEMDEERRKDDEVVVAQQKRIEEEAAGTQAQKEDGDLPASSQGSPSKHRENGIGTPKEKAKQRARSRVKDELLQMQELRRANIDQLVLQLTHVKEYYQWHAGPSAPVDEATA